MGFTDLTVTEQLEAFKKREAGVATAVGNKSTEYESDDSGGSSDDEGPPEFPFGYRGKTEHRGVGPLVKNSTIRPEKKSGDSKLEEQEDEKDELGELAIKAKADKKKK